MVKIPWKKLGVIGILAVLGLAAVIIVGFGTLFSWAWNAFFVVVFKLPAIDWVGGVAAVIIVPWIATWFRSIFFKK